MMAAPRAALRHDPCHVSLSGRHHWTAAAPERGLYVPHCRCCEHPADAPPLDPVDVPPRAPTATLLIAFSVLGVIGYGVLLALGKVWG